MITDTCEAIMKNQEVILAKYYCQICGIFILSDEIVKYKKKHYVQLLCPNCEEICGGAWGEIKPERRKNNAKARRLNNRHRT